MYIFAVDMDGTFLNSSNDYNRKYFNEIFTTFNNQFLFIVASSNTTSHLQSFFNDLNIYYVGSNGAAISYNNEIIHTHYIENADVGKTCELLEALSIDSYVVSTLESSYGCKNANDVFLARMNKYYDNLQVGNHFDSDHVTKITIELQVEAQRRIEIINHLNSKLKHSVAVDSGFHCIDIIHRNVNKATGIEYVLNLVNESKENLYVFGDSDNDLEMLQMTNHSYAMANANSRVKGVASEIIPSNDQDGVLKTMEKILKKEL
ncbi:Cof-type HAD-IIB family hydrolase [Macrococcoides caseolyticum]|uniref:Cof-type HAD-IIB family hydrolase n=1 Tax=Macrococcoides caseolyticum TaxID=69966 RepID=UPI001F2AFAE3|nr:Cof-type HAD-IIB family hydrolase [Macrococcus caseolyticus]MCE4957032.1 HAD family hydrolase [Macrococcus caseolyticus]